MSTTTWLMGEATALFPPAADAGAGEAPGIPLAMTAQATVVMTPARNSSLRILFSIRLPPNLVPPNIAAPHLTGERVASSSIIAVAFIKSG